jgi:pimeloyl-ACP methyl ester carboxylesterase
VLWEEATHIDQRAAVEGIRIPTLLIFGGASKVYPTDIGAWLESHLPDAIRIKLPRAGHMPFLDETERLADVISKFVSKSNPRKEY